VGLAGVLGDLVESLIKRDQGSKDASTLLPGFGGILDLVDALLLAGPVAYIWFVSVEMFAARTT
jgi:phosphatidate cytidylyltransferase